MVFPLPGDLDPILAAGGRATRITSGPADDGRGSRLQALRVATVFPAQTLGLDRDLGSLEPGKLADFVVMDRNPLERIENTAEALKRR